jgi:hypothetical protein
MLPSGLNYLVHGELLLVWYGIQDRVPNNCFVLVQARFPSCYQPVDVVDNSEILLRQSQMSGFM